LRIFKKIPNKKKKEVETPILGSKYVECLFILNGVFEKNKNEFPN